jgi:beclin 1
VCWVEADGRFLASHAALSGQITHLAHTLSSAKTQLLLSSDLLQHLESKNVYNDAFQIGHAPLLDPSALAPASGAAVKSSVTVGTINGLRLGGRPTVDWDEINAAWGLVALCIDRLAAKVGCTFEQSVKNTMRVSDTQVQDRSARLVLAHRGGRKGHVRAVRVL